MKSLIMYNDIAFILTWPDTIIRGDEKWMMFFKKIGIIKNLNFKVGHTAIVIVKRQTGKMLFYDFGRYSTPRGYGRARSSLSDPRLEIKLEAKFENEHIVNLQEIVDKFEILKPNMGGKGILYFSIVREINFELANAYGDLCVHKGTYPYGAIARNNNNCSRFITRMLIRSSKRYNWRHSINFPETIKASPISNLINAVSDRMIYSFTVEKGLRHFKMNRWQSFSFLLKKIKDNLTHKKAAILPNDIVIGRMSSSTKPIMVPSTAQYLGGICDGAWFNLQPAPDDKVIIKRYTTKGELEYIILGETTESVNLILPFEITYDSHLLFTHIKQNGRRIRINHILQLPINSLTNISG